MAQPQEPREPHKKLGEIKRKSSLSIHDARIAGLYDLEHTIGQGHFAVVKLARHVFTGEKVAVKVIDKTKLDPISTAHIMQEVRCMKLVQHPNIVRLYEVIDTQTKLFLILELGDYDMYDYIMRHNDIGCSEIDAQQHFNQIIKAIDYCHTLHVVHRDLKPENVVFFEKLGMVKLTDFGFSNLFTPGQQLETSCGSLAYSAPEILLGDAYDAPAVDVWSLGVILFMLVCGRLPFQEANDPETLTKILDCKFSLPETMSEECKSLIKRMLVREPSKRATLTEIVASAWVKAGDRGHAENLPLISRQQLSECAHATIIEQMIAGGIGTEEEIHSAIERDDYSYITATYYLLAERVLSKHRERQAQQLLIAAAKSEPRLANAVTRSDSQESGTSNQSGPTSAPVAATTPSGGGGTPGQAASSGVRSRSRSNSFRRHRPCTILKEESEEELSHYLRSSRQSSRNSSPSMSMFGTSPANRERFSPQAIQELLEMSATRMHSGRRTPESHRSSRSPSPPGSSGRTSPSVSALVTRLKQSAPVPGALRKLSSSPHLIGICEESEDAGEGGASSSAEATFVKRAPLPATYSSVRMIRPRQAVVSPDVIRRYENRVFTNRSRRSTSCSSSEASDDDSERRYNLIGSRYCRRSGDDDGDDEPPVGGGSGRGGSRRRQQAGNLATTSEANEVDAAGGSEKRTRAAAGSNGSTTTTATAATCRDLDAGKLIGKLQKLVLHPIREIPSATSTLLARLFARSTAASRVAEWWQHCALSDDGAATPRAWFQRLRKPKSCENVFHTSGVVVDNTSSAGAQSTMALLCKENNCMKADNDEEEEEDMKSTADSGVSSTGAPDSQTESDEGDSEDSVEDDQPVAKRKSPHAQQHHKLTKRARAALRSQALASSRLVTA